MEEFRQTLEQLLPNVIYQEQWEGKTCFNQRFISKIIEIMVSQDLNITDDDLDDFARMSIDEMIEKRPDLLGNVLTAMRKDKSGTVKFTPEYLKKKVEQWAKDLKKT